MNLAARGSDVTKQSLPPRAKSYEPSMYHNNFLQHRNRTAQYRWKTAVNTNNFILTASSLRWLIVLGLFSCLGLNIVVFLHSDIKSESLLRSITRKRPDIPWITSQAQPFNENGVAAQAKNLIIVAGHSVTISGHLQDADHDESDWYMLEYQKRHGLPEAILGHIKTGIEYAAADPSSLLLFSGGQTRAVTGPESEGSSYYRVADAMHLWTLPLPSKLRRGGSFGNTSTQTLRARTATEEFATDSFQNLLFSICRFYEITRSYPQKITVISYTFKQHRFETLHVPALHWPLDRFEYIGVDPPITAGFDLDEATKGELENAAKPFENDPYGCHSSILQQKRHERNPFARTPPYDLSCPDMVELMHYCNQEYIDVSKVPWRQ
jgi:hypothetical protein